MRRTKVLTQGVRQSKRLDPSNHLGKDFRGEGLLDAFIFRDLAGDAVLEEVVQPPPKVTPLRQRLHPRAFVAGSATS